MYQQRWLLLGGAYVVFGCHLMLPVVPLAAKDLLAAFAHASLTLGERYRAEGGADVGTISGLVWNFVREGLVFVLSVGARWVGQCALVLLHEGPLPVSR